LVATLASNGGVVCGFLWRIIRNAHSHKKPTRGEALTYEGIQYVVKRAGD
jgi:hypothetical protein